MPAIESLPTKVLDLDAIKPYWRNPRRMSEEAVNAVAASIETYGYAQPIVVDTEDVIIIGHTRYAAMRRLGITSTPVAVADLPVDKAKQLRVIDNRTSEFSSWDFESLVAELADLDASLLVAYFPEVTPTDDPGLPSGAGSGRDWTQSWDAVEPDVEFVCPSCFHTFEVHVTREDVLNGHLASPTQEAQQ